MISLSYCIVFFAVNYSYIYFINFARLSLLFLLNINVLRYPHTVVTYVIDHDIDYAEVIVHCGYVTMPPRVETCSQTAILTPPHLTPLKGQ